MKLMVHSVLIIVLGLVLTFCKSNEDNLNLNSTLDEFCSVVPDGWECELISNNFIPQDIPRNADNPVAIIKYSNPNIVFAKYGDTKVNPSLTLDFYSIKQKEELIKLIQSQRIFSWCIPIYYGETNKYFIVTSPCFINGGYSTDEANDCIDDLHDALRGIIMTKDFGIN